MKAVILAGGRGKRLKPITDYVPKPLVPISNVPIIEWQIRFLKKFRVEEVIVCSGYRSEMIENYLSAKDLGIETRFSVEREPLGTGGAIKKAARTIRDESFLVMNGDIITNISLSRLVRTENAIAAIELRQRFGILETDGDRITGFSEKKEIPDLWMNAGIYHLQRRILKDLPYKGDIERTLFPEYARNGRISTVKFRDVKWHSIDSFKDMEEASLNVSKMMG